MNLGLAELAIVLVILAVMAAGVAVVYFDAVSGGRKAAERDLHRDGFR